MQQDKTVQYVPQPLATESIVGRSQGEKKNTFIETFIHSINLKVC